MNVLDFKVKNSRGEETALEDYRGKVLLIVNTATKCGLTPQYEALQQMYDDYRQQGFEILDFPCNQFMHQAPGTDEEISEFCTLNYSTTFPRFAKIEVNGDKADPLYQYLKEAAPVSKGEKKSFLKKILPLGKNGDISWNFAKFLVDKNGDVVGRYAPTCLPEELRGDIEAALAR